MENQTLDESFLQRTHLPSLVLPLFANAYKKIGGGKLFLFTKTGRSFCKNIFRVNVQIQSIINKEKKILKHHPLPQQNEITTQLSILFTSH